MRSYVEIIGSGSYDCSSSIQLFFDDGRYLFECGDGTQRLCTEYGTRLSKLRGVYLSTLTAPSVGGLFGLLLTAADTGKQKMSIIGPTGLAQLFLAAKSFYYRPAFVNTLHEIELNAPQSAIPITVTDDDCVTIQAVPVNSRRDVEIDTAFGMHCDAVSYICRLQDLRGKFNPEKALQLGVKKGRMFGLLQKGKSVVLDSGKEIKSSEVMSADTPGPIVLIIACPSLHHIDNLTSSSAFHLENLNLAVSGDGKPQRTCVFCHLGPREVLMHPKYREWCDSFGDAASHIPLHSSMSRRQTVFASQAEDLALLHFTLDKELFPLPQDCLFPDAPETLEQARTIMSEKSALGISVSAEPVKEELDKAWEVFKSWHGRWIGSECKLKFMLSPAANIGLDRTDVRARFIERKPGQPLLRWRDVVPSHGSEPAPAGGEMAKPASVAAMTPNAAAVRFLGTGAAIPGKHRNVSATMVDLFVRGSVLLDCGEGTWGQMVRMFGKEGAQRAVASLRIVFISHMHADHHLGLMNVLHQRSVAMRERPDLQHGPQLVLIGPGHLQAWLEGFQQAAKVPLRDYLRTEQRSYRFFDARNLTDPQTVESKFFIDAFGLDVGCVDVVHCPLSYGLVIRDCIHNWKVVYSGDTRPCSALALAGRDATLAIHEATLEDELNEEAEEKLHCTTSEALTICSEQMKAWRTILTHFSQRYPKIPKLDDSVIKKLYNARAAVAFDMMCVDFTRLGELPRIVPAIRDCFPEEGQ